MSAYFRTDSTSTIVTPGAGFEEAIVDSSSQRVEDESTPGPTLAVRLAKGQSFIRRDRELLIEIETFLEWRVRVCACVRLSGLGCRQFQRQLFLRLARKKQPDGSAADADANANDAGAPERQDGNCLNCST